jgi:hypothetical protein
VDTRDDETAELWRTVVRVVLADVAGQILLLNLVEPKYPELGDCWELPGGIDPGEDVFMGRAARAGDALRIPVTDIAAPRWFRFVTFLHAGARRIQDEAMPTPPSRPSSPSDHPQRRRNEIYLGYSWWTILPPPRWPSTKYRIASVPGSRGRSCR